MTQLRRLLPDPAQLTPAEAMEGLAFGERAPADRPHVAVNFVESVDGRAAFEGRSGALGDEVDRELFHGLRGRVDAVLVGTGTLRADHGVRSLLCEGGPTVFGALVHERLVDELFVTLSPKLAGGMDPLTILQGPRLPEPEELELRWVLEAGGSLFLRYGVPLG